MLKFWTGKQFAKSQVSDNHANICNRLKRAQGHIEEIIITLAIVILTFSLPNLEPVYQTDTE